MLKRDFQNKTKKNKNMILRRLGNKQAIAQDIEKYFPYHRLYIEPFFGAGGMFFNKRKSKYNMLNDLDSDVFNLFQIVSTKKNELEAEFNYMPIHSDLLDYWKKEKETEPIRKALRFLFLSNFTTPGIGDLRRNGFSKDKKILNDNIKKTFDFINETNARFWNEDFRVFISRVMLRGDERPLQDLDTFFYCDPPYLGTNDNYSNSFTEQDSIDLFDALQATGCKFAMSEFDNEFILNQAKERGLNVIIIGERKNLKNRRTEILITNYEKQKGLFD